MDTVGGRLRQVRQDMHLSQAEFGKLGGVLKQAQLKYEKGDRTPDAAYFEALGKAGVDVRYVVTGQRITPAEMELERRLSHVRAASEATVSISGLTKQQQAQVMDVVFQARMSSLPEDEAKLLDDYRKADETGRAIILASAAAAAAATVPNAQSPPAKKPPKPAPRTRKPKN